VTKLAIYKEILRFLVTKEFKIFIWNSDSVSWRRVTETEEFKQYFDTWRSNQSFFGTDINFTVKSETLDEVHTFLTTMIDFEQL
jgi:hypothetical protein